MPIERQITVFEAFRPFIRILTVYSSTSFRNNHQRIRNIGLAVACTTIIFGLVVLELGDVLYCIKYDFDLDQIALPFAVIVSGTQMATTYIAIGLKHRQLERAVIGLTTTVNRRKRLFFSYPYR